MKDMEKEDVALYRYMGSEHLKCVLMCGFVCYETFLGV